MQATSRSFSANARAGLADPVLQTALGLARTGFPLRRQQAIERLPEFEALREEGRAIKDHSLAHLDFYLEVWERNVLAATGSGIIVTNEGNGDLTQTLPRIHIVVTSLEKIVPTLEDAATLLRLLARSATGQEFSSYTTISTGPRRAGDLDGPEQYHVVLVDNGRSAMFGGEFQDMLRCLRCAACLNHCPVYAAVVGHAYGWVYPGPMGAVLTPALVGVGEAGHLPNASTFCGRCESVCPVKIPLPKMMRHWRERQFAERLAPPVYRSGLRLWAALAQRPRFYHAFTEIAGRVLGWAGKSRGRYRALPSAAGWTQVRDMPAPEGRSFHSLWAERQRRAGAGR